MAWWIEGLCAATGGTQAIHVIAAAMDAIAMRFT
jgi:hypothetical protein